MAEKVCVFLSSKEQLPAYCRVAAEEVGAWIGRTGRTLVYGGARKGLMETLAQATKAAGGRVFGVVPQVIEDRGLVSATLDVTFRTADLNDRKAVMLRESDVCVVLPGGIGTLDEFFTVLAADVIGTARRPVVLYNAGHFWDPLLRLFDHLEHEGVAAETQRRWWQVADNLEELEACVREALDGGEN